MLARRYYSVPVFLLLQYTLAELNFNIPAHCTGTGYSYIFHESIAIHVKDSAVGSEHTFYLDRRHIKEEKVLIYCKYESTGKIRVLCAFKGRIFQIEDI